ncbi:unnamed protein product [Rotaria magnacalcarata]|uniref:F-box domain-containing protein n=2 Tax=Rotaria magnacalcarata TaxID=392030 RepID=A0A816MSR3_9BILA|nr:unnamed protein product [Rotaria magnacalcarata]
MHAQNEFKKLTMNKSTLESLPNEVFLIIFGYLLSFDLCQAFLDVKNARIEHLLTSMRHSLDVSSMHYDQLCQFLSERNDHTNHFPALIHTPVLRDSSACMMLRTHWETRVNKWLLSIKKLLILDAEDYQFH